MLGVQCFLLLLGLIYTRGDEEVVQNKCLGGPNLKRHCGFPGISKYECAKRSCCYDSSIPGVNQCFFSRSQEVAQNECLGGPNLKRPCGYPGISKYECAKRSCCYDSSIPGVNQCFFSRSQGDFLSSIISL